jgi:hypothetical protein
MDNDRDIKFDIVIGQGYSRKKGLLGAECPWNLGVPPIDLD